MVEVLCRPSNIYVDIIIASEGEIYNLMVRPSDSIMYHKVKYIILEFIIYIYFYFRS